MIFTIAEVVIEPWHIPQNWLQYVTVYICIILVNCNHLPTNNVKTLMQPGVKTCPCCTKKTPQKRKQHANHGSFHTTQPPCTVDTHPSTHQNTILLVNHLLVPKYCWICEGAGNPAAVIWLLSRTREDNIYRTLSPIIMRKLKLEGPIFHFDDFGRKGTYKMVGFM